MRVGVVGAGVMGAGVAESLAEAGHDVLLVDLDDEALTRATDAIVKSLRTRKLVHKQRDLPEASVLLSRIEPSTDYSILEKADFVIENVTEDIALKDSVYRQLDAICPSETVFAADTSCVPVDLLAASTNRPDRVIGIHFMNPVALKDTVEVIRGPKTSAQTLETSLQLIASMNKEAIVVKDSPGFVSNRVLMLTINEAIHVLEEGIAPAADIDAIFTKCFGHKMGPLATADLIGLDTILLSLLVLLDRLSDSKFEPASLLRQKVNLGELGRKSGKGFHEYPRG